MNRFTRTEKLLGAGAMDRLRAARVTVVGLGAVGSYAAEALARSGIGTLRLVDFDTVRLSNVNRQLYALESTLGRPKTDVARERVLDIHPACRVETMCTFVDAAGVDAVLDPAPDLLIDAIDSVGPKVTLLAACARHGVRAVSSMGAAMRTDPLAVRTGRLFESRACPLARLVRKRLKKRGVGPGADLRCVYSVEEVPERAREPGDIDEDPAGARGRPRTVLGSFACLTGIFGLVAAREAIIMLTAPPPPCADNGLSSAARSL
jgi:tRNA A37 threonylcarbamoyladenosine dehydratase